MFQRETKCKYAGFNLMHYKYKSVILPLASEMATWKNWKKAFIETKVYGLKQSQNGG